VTTLARLEDVFRSVLGRDDISFTAHTTPAQVPGWDSVAHINLMYSIEETFGVQFPGNRLAEFKTIGELVHYLDENGRSG